MHITDWYPTLLHLAGHQDFHLSKATTQVEGQSSEDIQNFLDGVNNWEMLVSDGAESARNEILHNINPMYNSRFLWFQCGKSLTPSTAFNNSYNVVTSRGNAALRMDNWKLIIGDPGS